MPLSSDPHAWLRLIFRTLQSRSAFVTFAPSIQFEQLVQAVQDEHPSKAAEMREWSVAAQHALLRHLASMVEQGAIAEPTEFWVVHKGDRELRCFVHHLPTGLDVRLMEQDGFRRTQLCRDAPVAHALADNWRAALVDVEWTAT